MARPIHSLAGKKLGVDNLNYDLIGHSGSVMLRHPDNIVSVVTATSVAITRELYDGKKVVLNRAGGIIVNLPAATSTTLGMELDFYLPVSLSGTTKIKVANASDTITGHVQVDASLASNAPVSFTTGSTADTVSLNGTTTGGKKGDHFKFTVISSNLWAVEGEIQATGTSATPFVVSV